MYDEQQKKAAYRKRNRPFGVLQEIEQHFQPSYFAAAGFGTGFLRAHESVCLLVVQLQAVLDFQ